MIKIKIYYIKQGKNKIFRKINLYENNCEILKHLDNQLRINSIINQMLKNKIELAVLSKELYDNKAFLNELIKYNIKIFDTFV